MTPQEIKAAADTIINELTNEQRDYARSESARRRITGQAANTPFSCLHDLMDANELLPPASIDWDAPGGADFTDANAIMEILNDRLTAPAPISAQQVISP